MSKRDRGRLGSPIRGVAAVAILATGVVASGPAAQEREQLVARGREAVVQRGCYACHTIGAVGTPIAPDLGNVAARYRETDLARWLVDLAEQAPTRHMPPLALSASDARAIAAYLSSLR